MNFYVKIYHAKIPFYRHLRETRYNMSPLILCNYQVQLNTKRLYVKPLIVLRFLFDILRQQIWYIYCCTLFNSYWGQKKFIAYNIHILSEDIQFICTERKPSLWWKKPTAKLSEKSKNKRCSNSFQWCSLPRPCVYVAIQDQLKTIEVSAFISSIACICHVYLSCLFVRFIRNLHSKSKNQTFFSQL